ncbi:MAG: hypothetical protein LBD76_02585 [Prevotellaceae bacterium]|jgi:hypothetical protein|nr:hypothetical protein [Prevotellaceae bacterium]
MTKGLQNIRHSEVPECLLHSAAFVPLLGKCFLHSAAFIVALGGTFLQIFRGIIVALMNLPLRKVFFEEKHGLIKLGVIILGGSLLFTIVPAMGSFEGYIHIYTRIPVIYQISGHPEAIIYILLFIGLLNFSKKYGHKRIVTILSIIMVLLSSMGIMGYLTVNEMSFFYTIQSYVIRRSIICSLPKTALYGT